jgi:hypothetical protein
MKSPFRWGGFSRICLSSTLSIVRAANVWPRRKKEELVVRQYFAGKKIAFTSLFDGRLKRFGICATANNSTGALSGPDGIVTTVHKDSDGCARLTGKMSDAVCNAIAREFEFDIPLFSVPLTHVVAEGPCCDGQFMHDWLASAIECDRIVQLHCTREPEFRELFGRLPVVYGIHFTSAATAFIRKLMRDCRSFSLNLINSSWADSFAIMVGIGFFTRFDERYRMIIPRELSSEVITESLLQLAGTEDDDDCLHPERHLATMSSCCAKDLRQRLRKSLPFSVVPNRLKSRRWMVGRALNWVKSGMILGPSLWITKIN